VFAAVPTWKEQGVECDVGAWRGAAAAVGIAPGPIGFWQQLLSRAVRTEEWKEEAERYSWTDMYVDGDALEAYLKKEYAEFEEILGDLGLLKV
jgi:putative tricarboxylic transport membrane protein